MPSEKDTYEAIETFLHGLPDYVVLRNHDFRANLGRGGDVDVLVTDMAAARTGMTKALGRPWWVMRRTYVEGCFYHWGHIDLTPRMEWHGATYIDNSTIFSESTVSSFGFLQPRLAHEALICWFASLIWGGFFKNRYGHAICNAAISDGEAFQKALIHAVGDNWGKKLFALALAGEPEKSEQWVKPLRRKLWMEGFKRRPLETLLGWKRQWMREIKMRITSPVPWFAIQDEDGVADEKILEGIKLGLKQLGIRPRLREWRPEMIKSGLTEEIIVPPSKSVPIDGCMKSTVNLIFLWLDWTIGFRLRIADDRARGAFIIFHRFHEDLISNPNRYRYGGSRWLARLVSSTLPQPDGIIQLTSGANDSLSCKSHMYLAIDRSKADSDVIEEVVAFISESTGKHSRNLISFPS